MKRWLWGLPLLLLALVAQGAETLSHGRFKRLTLHRPTGEIRQFVLLLSGGPTTARVTSTLTRLLLAEHAMVAVVDTPALSADFAGDDDECAFAAGDAENLARYVEGYARLPAWFPPVLIGLDEQAPLAYALLAQAPPGTFGGALSVGFCPQLTFGKPLCAASSLRVASLRAEKKQLLLPAQNLSAPWRDVSNQQLGHCPARAVGPFRQVPRTSPQRQVSAPPSAALPWLGEFRTAWREIAASGHATPLAPPAALHDLPLIEVPASGNGALFAVLVSGDGGWAGLDKELAAALATQGVPVVGVDSLRYFWQARTPEGVASDVDRVIRHYADAWRRPKVLLIGFSQGADVLPFALNRLPTATRAQVAGTALLGPGEKASFEFHLENWLGHEDSGLPLRPEIARLKAADTLCLYGEEDEDALCPHLPATEVRTLGLTGGHHLDGDYAGLARRILEALPAQ